MTFRELRHGECSTFASSKTAPSRPPRGEGGWQSQRLKTGPYTTKALSANGSNLVLPLGGVSGGLNAYAEVSDLSVAVEGQSFIR